MFRKHLLGAVTVGGAALTAACVPAANTAFVQPEPPLMTVQRAEQCAPVVERQVEALGLSGRVESITYVDDDLQRGGDDDFDILRGVIAWVDVSDCQGYVVIDMRPTCRIKQIYPRGECTVPTPVAG